MSARCHTFTNWRLALAFGGTTYAIAYIVLRYSEAQTLAGWINTIVQTGLDVIAGWLAYRIWQRVTKNQKPIVFLLVLAGGCGVVSDGVYGYLVNIAGLPNPDTNPKAIYYLVAYVFYLLLWLAAWIGIAFDALRRQWLRIEVILAVIVLFLGLTSLFAVLYLPIVFQTHNPIWTKTLHCVLTGIELFGVFAATICMVLLPRTSIVFTSLGFSFLTVADCTLRVSEILTILPKVSPFEILWTVGQIFIVAGMACALEEETPKGATSQMMFRASLSSVLSITCLTPSLVGCVLALLIGPVGIRASALLAVFVFSAAGICIVSKNLQDAIEVLLSRITIIADKNEMRPQDWLARFLWGALNFEQVVAILPASGKESREIKLTVEQINEKYMGDVYKVSQSQVGAVGPNAHVHDFTFAQNTLDQVSRMDMDKLAAELEVLRASLGSRTQSSADAQALGAVIEARDAARRKSPQSVLLALRQAGKWAFDVAKDIGVALAAEAISLSLGLK